MSKIEIKELEDVRLISAYTEDDIYYYDQNFANSELNIPIWYPNQVAANPQRNPLYKEWSEMMVVIALDPGETTGWSLIATDSNFLVGVGISAMTKGQTANLGLDMKKTLSESIHLHWHGQVDCGRKFGKLHVSDTYDPGLNPDGEGFGVNRLMWLIDQWPNAAIVIEDFIPNFSKLKKDRAGLSPVRVTARIEHELWKRDRYLIRQAVSEAKGTMTDERLREMGAYDRKGGLNHARDADRHATLFLRKAQRSAEIRHIGWPKQFGKPVKVAKRQPREPGERI